MAMHYVSIFKDKYSGVERQEWVPDAVLEMLVTTRIWSPASFKTPGSGSNGCVCDADFVHGSNILVGDIDGELSIEQFKQRFAGKKFWICPTKRHQVEQLKEVKAPLAADDTEQAIHAMRSTVVIPATDRYRYIFFLDDNIQNADEHLRCRRWLFEQLPESDANASRLGQRWSPSKSVQQYDGERLSLKDILRAFPSIPKKLTKVLSSGTKHVEDISLADMPIPEQLRELLEGNAVRDVGHKLRLTCILPEHGDTQASAVFFKDGGNYHCSGCGESLSLKALLETLGIEPDPETSFLMENGFELTKLQEKLLRSECYDNMEKKGEFLYFDAEKHQFWNIDHLHIQSALGPLFEKWRQGSISSLYREWKPNQSFKLVNDFGLEAVNTYQAPEWKKELFYKGVPIASVEMPACYQSFFLHLVDNDKESLEYLLDWMATSLKGRNYTVLTTIGTTGIGKGVLFKILRLLHGKQNAYETKSNIFKERFNEQIFGKTLVYVPEVLLSNNIEWTNFKLVVEDFQEIEGKGKTAFNTENFASWYMSANYMTSVKLEPNDRRLSMIALTSTKLDLMNTVTAGFSKLQDYCDHLMTPALIEQLAQYLWNREVTRDMTQVFRDPSKFKELKEGSLEEWEEYLLNDYHSERVGQPEQLFSMVLDRLRERYDRSYERSLPRGKTISGNRLEYLAGMFPEKLQYMKKGSKRYVRFVDAQK